MKCRPTAPPGETGLPETSTRSAAGSARQTRWSHTHWSNKQSTAPAMAAVAAMPPGDAIASREATHVPTQQASDREVTSSERVSGTRTTRPLAADVTGVRGGEDGGDTAGGGETCGCETGTGGDETGDGRTGAWSAIFFSSGIMVGGAVGVRSFMAARANGIRAASTAPAWRAASFSSRAHGG